MGHKRGQLQDWYPNEKMVVVPICSNGRCFLQGVWVLYCINKNEGDEPLPLLDFRGDVINTIFLRYS